MSNSQINIEDLYDWLEQQPELANLREQAAGTPCEYRPAEPTPELRLTTNAISELPADNNGVIAKLWEIIWVPGRKMRGKAFSTPELDASLSSVAKLMCISTLWDFVTTIPLFSFSLSLFAWASVPAGTALSFILLWASNVAGENATDRRPRHAAKANWSLVAFVLLCTAKTVVSGVGIDLMIGSKAIASEYAQRLANERLEKDEKTLLEKFQNPGPELAKANQECDSLQNRIKDLEPTRQQNKDAFTTAYVLAFGMYTDQQGDKGLSNQELVKKYASGKGVCRRRDALVALQKEENAAFTASIDRRKKAIEQLPPLKYLQQYQPDLFNEHFRIEGNKLIWVNGSEAVGEATEQFYRKLLEGKFGLLGFSLFSLAISIVLTGAASIMLYMAGKDPQVQASFTGDLERYRNNRLSDYEKLVKQEEA
jgi:hypothetical protein